MKVSRLLVIAIVFALPTVVSAGKKDDDRIAALEERVTALEQALEQRTAELEALVDEKMESVVTELAQREQRAAEEVRAITQLAGQGDQLQAKSRLDAFFEKYAGTQAERSLGRVQQELEVVGKEAPDAIEVTHAYVGESTPPDLTGKGTSLLVFFEEWCPHCKREVPRLQQTYEKYRDRGLRVLGLTKVTKSATDEKVEAFCAANGLSFPVLKESGQASAYFNVSGIPAAAVIRDGKVVWRGHPARLNEAMIEGWL